MKYKSLYSGQIIDLPDDAQVNPRAYVPVGQPTGQNPTVPTTTAQPQQDFMSGLLNFGKDAILGMASPFIRTGQNILGSLFESGRGAGINQTADMSTGLINQLNQINAQLRVEQDPMKKQALLFKSRQISDALSKTGQMSTRLANTPNPVMTNQELGSRSTIPGAAAEAARNTAGIMSYAVPYGKGANFLTRAVLPGAAQGGMFAASKEGATAGDVGTGALTGGLTSGALYGLGKLFRGMKGAGDALRKEVINPQIDSSPWYMSSRDELIDFANKKLNLGTGGADIKLRGLNKAWNDSQTAIKSELAKTKIQALYSTVVKDFESSLEKSQYLEDIPGYKGAKDIFLKRLLKIFDHGSASAENIYALKSELAGELDKVFGKSNLTPKDEVKMALFDSLKNTLNRLNENLAPINEEQRMMFQLAEGLVKNSQAKFRLPIFGVHVSEQPYQNIGDSLGNMLQKVGGVGGVINKIQQNPITGHIPVPATQEILKGLTKPSQNAIPYPSGNVPTPNGANIPGIPQEKTNDMGGQKITFNQIQQILLSPAISDKTKERFKYIYETQQKEGNGKSMSAVTAKDLSRNQTALRDIQLLEQQIASDPLAIIKNAIPGSPGARQYRATIGGILDAIGTNRTGAAYTKEQRKDYEYLLPIVGDSPETISFKLQRIKAEIQTYLQNIEQSSSTDVSGLSSLQ